ncbi:MAG: CitT [Comamonadaceae bacterium]|nr:MAG: CitT [Comamonadaceae bacterium]
MLMEPSVAEIADRLLHDPLFADLSGRAHARLLGAARVVHVVAGQSVASSGAPATELQLVLRGSLALRSFGDEARGPALSVGEEALTGQAQYCRSAVAVTDCCLIALPRRALQELLGEAPELAKKAQEVLLCSVGGVTPPVVPVKPARGPAATPPRELWGWACTLLWPALLLAAGLWQDWAIQNTLFVAILAATVSMWMFSIVDEFVPPLFAMTAMLLVDLAPAKVVLSGFASSGLILFVGVYVLGGVLVASGLSYRFILWMRLHLPDTPFWHGFALVASGYALSPIMPSGNARLSLLAPLYRDFCSADGVKPGGLDHTRLAAATLAGSMNMSPMFLTSKSANLIVFAMLPAQLQEEFQGFFWFLAAIVCALVVTLGHFVLDRVFFGPGHALPASKAQVRQQLQLLGALSRDEQFVLGALGVFLLGATGVTWHHISLPWVAGFVLVALLFYGLVSKKSFQNFVDWPMVFFLLSLQGLTGTMDHLHLVEQLTPWMDSLAALLQHDITRLVLLELAVVLVIRLALPITAGMVVSAILFMPIAEATGINPWLIGFLAAMFSDLWFLPYQSSAYSQLRSVSGIATGFNEPLFLKFNLASCALRVVAVFVSIPFWDALDLI